MENKFKARSKKLNIAKNMPPSYHKLPGTEYDVKKSEVVKWLIEKPLILEFVWDHIRQSGYVVYDSGTGKWQGVDYDN